MFHLRQPSKSGSGSIAEELLAIEKITGQKQAELEYPPLTPAFNEVISHYYKITDLTDLGIKAYCDIMGITLSPDDVEVLKDIHHVSKLVNNGKNSNQVLGAFGWLD